MYPIIAAILLSAVPLDTPSVEALKIIKDPTDDIWITGKHESIQVIAGVPHELQVGLPDGWHVVAFKNTTNTVYIFLPANIYQDYESWSFQNAPTPEELKHNLIELCSKAPTKYWKIKDHSLVNSPDQLAISVATP